MSNTTPAAAKPAQLNKDARRQLAAAMRDDETLEAIDEAARGSGGAHASLAERGIKVENYHADSSDYEITLTTKDGGTASTWLDIDY